MIPTKTVTLYQCQWNIFLFDLPMPFKKCHHIMMPFGEMDYNLCQILGRKQVFLKRFTFVGIS